MTMSHDEYRELKAFLSFYSSEYLSVDSVPPEMRPAAVLETLEKKNARIAPQGLRQAINDIIERSRHLGPKEAEKIDCELGARNLATLSELKRRFSKEYARIFKR